MKKKIFENMISTGAPIAPIASTPLSVKIKTSYENFKRNKKRKSNESNSNIK
jgi:hypothetical protein